MSIPNLPVDFKDDILASSNTKRKYRQTTNGDSTVSFEDVTNYSQEGSEFGAKEVNQTNTAINNIYDERVLDVDALELITEPGFFVDAQVVKELNGKTKYYFSGIAWTDPVYSINKKAGIVYIDYYCVVSGGVGGRAFPIATLPEGVRPPNRIRSQAWCAGGNSMRHGASIDISTDGVIQFIAGGDFVEAGFTLSYLL